jgi:hypothetical protein
MNGLYEQYVLSTLPIKTCMTMIRALEDVIDSHMQELVDIVYIFTAEARARKFELSALIASYRTTLGQYEERLKSLQASLL